MHHERRYLSDPKSTLLIIGYQTQGSLGRQILDGAKTVKIFGEKVPVKCHVHAIGGYSAHADREQLLRWLKPMQPTLKKVFMIHAEDDQSIPCAQRIKRELGIDAAVPRDRESVVI